MSKRKSTSLLEQAHDAVEEIKPVVESSLESAYETAKDALTDGREVAAQALTDGREVAAHAIAEARSEAKKRCGRGRGSRRTGKRRLRTAVLLAAVLGVGAAVFKALRSRGEQPPWESGGGSAPRGVPTPAPTPNGATAAVAADQVPPVPSSPAVVGPDDAAGAAPGEALSDARDESEPKADTTPDDPAEVVELQQPETPGDQT